LEILSSIEGIDVSMNPKDIVRMGYDKISHTYRGDIIDPTNPEHLRYTHWVTELLTVLPVHAPVLDLGCGNGLPTAKLLADAGCAVAGVDISSMQVVRAQALVPNAQFICADMTELAFSPATFAAIVSFYAIIHIPLAEQPSLFANMHRWLQPGGYMMATVGVDAWTGAEDDWLDVPDAPMYWSHADAAMYYRWFEDQGFTIQWTRFIPEGQSGHTLMFAQKPL
jgi:SAM-dependent methyltransferase